MKHVHSADGKVDVNLKVDIPKQDITEVIETITACAAFTIGFYMVADTVRSVIKSAL